MHITIIIMHNIITLQRLSKFNNTQHNSNTLHTLTLRIKLKLKPNVMLTKFIKLII